VEQRHLATEDFRGPLPHVGVNTLIDENNATTEVIWVVDAPGGPVIDRRAAPAANVAEFALFALPDRHGLGGVGASMLT